MDYSQAIPGARVRLIADKSRAGIVVHPPAATRDDDPVLTISFQDGLEQKCASSELELMSFPGGTRVRVIGNEARTGKVTERPARESLGVPQMHVNFDDGAQSWVRSSTLEPVPATCYRRVFFTSCLSAKWRVAWRLPASTGAKPHHPKTMMISIPILPILAASAMGVIRSWIS
jgi:hypothetical protein